MKERLSAGRLRTAGRNPDYGQRDWRRHDSSKLLCVHCRNNPGCDHASHPQGRLVRRKGRWECRRSTGGNPAKTVQGNRAGPGEYTVEELDLVDRFFETHPPDEANAAMRLKAFRLVDALTETTGRLYEWQFYVTAVQGSAVRADSAALLEAGGVQYFMVKRLRRAFSKIRDARCRRGRLPSPSFTIWVSWLKHLRRQSGSTRRSPCRGTGAVAGRLGA